MGKRDTTVTHRFSSWVISASWHGYTVTDYHTPQAAIDAVRGADNHITDWRAFRHQAPCDIPREIDTAILSYYRGMYGML